MSPEKAIEEAPLPPTAEPVSPAAVTPPPSPSPKKRVLKKKSGFWSSVRKVARKVFPCIKALKKKKKKKPLPGAFLSRLTPVTPTEGDPGTANGATEGNPSRSSNGTDMLEMTTMVENPMRAKANKGRGGGSPTRSPLSDVSNGGSPERPGPRKRAPPGSPDSKRPSIAPLNTPPPPAGSPAMPKARRSSLLGMMTGGMLGSESPEVESPGPARDGFKTGWLYRENELSQHDRSEETWLRKWCCIVDKRMLYQETEPMAGASVVAQGYIDLPEGSTVKFTHLEKLGVASSESKGKYCFMVKEPNDTNNAAPFSITWSAGGEKDRDDWVEAIKGAIELKPSADVSARGLPPLRISAVDSDQIDISSAELPSKVGMLKKYAIGGFMGVKTVKTRWFRLDGGELRYYADEDMRPIKLKGTVALNSAVLLRGVPGATAAQIHLEVSKDSSGTPTVLIMEAATDKEATEWCFALQETLLALRVRGTSSSQTKRRQNLMDLSGKSTAKSSRQADSPTSDSFGANRLEARTERMLETCMGSHFLMKKIQDTKGLMRAFKPCTRLPGDIIISQGSSGDFFYLLEQGGASVLKDGAHLGAIPAGKSFGDLALLNSSARTATVKANSLCTLWTLDRLTLRSFLQEHERKELAGKMAFLRTVKLFEQISDYTLEKIADVMQQVVFKAKDVIFRRGDVGECMYMVVSGRVSIYVSSITGSRTEFVRLGANKFFGELALLDNAPRAASAAAIDKCTCWTVDRSNFVALVGSVKQAREESIGVEILKKVKLMEGLADKQLITVARCLTTVEFAKDDTIIHQGEDGDIFYMIAQGEVIVEINHVEVAHLSDHAFFGEGSLMKNEKRSATIIAATDVVCLSLSRTDFNRLLGPIAEEIKAASAARAKAAETDQGFFGKLESLTESLFSSSELATGLKDSRAAKATAESQALLASTNKLFDLDQLDRVHVLGHGTFSAVYLVRHTQNDTFYALKVLHKQHLHKTHQERIVFTERDTMKMFDHSFFTALYSTFQDEGCLYMVQQFIPGGDVWQLIYKNNRLERTRTGGLRPETASFYAANVLTVLCHLAEMDVVFRDLKPENFGLDSSGYLRVFDFGCAKVMVGEETSNTMVGTPEYLSPEMIMSKGHGRGVDIWSFGIFLYELLAAKTPFDHANKALIYQNVMGSEEELRVVRACLCMPLLLRCVCVCVCVCVCGCVHELLTNPTPFSLLQAFAKDFDAEAKNLIKRLLVPNPHMRLGMLRLGLADIWAHPFITREGKTERGIGLKNMTAPLKVSVRPVCGVF